MLRRALAPPRRRGPCALHMTHAADPIDELEDAAPGRADLRRALKELGAIYRRADELMAAVSCPRSSRCCRLALTRREPFLLPLERLALATALERRGRAWPSPRSDGACALLDQDGRGCSIYADRPFGCRTFFCELAQGKAPPNQALHALSARMTRASDLIEPAGEPVPITQLFKPGRNCP